MRQIKSRPALRRTLCVLLCVLCLTALLPGSAVRADSSFSDVPDGAWYKTYIDQITRVSGIIDGYPDGTFRPDKQVTRAEFLKMILEAVQMAGTGLFTTSQTFANAGHWAWKYYTLAYENNVLVGNVYADSGVMFPCTPEALDTPITRYEMAVILNNVCTNIGLEKTVVVKNAADYIPDYYSISATYLTAVEQAYGKGYLTGMEDGSFCGDRSLKRSEAAAVIYRYLWGGTTAAFASEGIVQTVSVSSDFVPFAVQYRSMTDSERHLALFGNANKTYFYSEADAAGYMQTITVPIWTLDLSGNKISSSASLTVHKLVAQEVQLIFEQIYNDPEQFPIYGGWSIGGSRYTDTMRHSWGCAIDINALYNCECTTNWNSGYTNVTCGYGWYPLDSFDVERFRGSLTSWSPYSISAGSSVVKAFSDYGWGWGGQGYSLHSDGSQKYDFMHFSILESGG